MPKALRHALAAAVLVIALPLLGGCDAPAATSPLGTNQGSGEPLVTFGQGVAPTTAGDPSAVAAIGPWRRVPFVPSPVFSAPFEAGCRGSSADLATVPLQVVDVRGGDTVTLLF